MIVSICNDGPVSLENSASYREDASRRAPPPYPNTASSAREPLSRMGKMTSKRFVIQQPLKVTGVPDISLGGLKTKPAPQRVSNRLGNEEGAFTPVHPQTLPAPHPSFANTACGIRCWGL